MLLSRATEILSILADGIDPVTGELLPEDSVCSEPEVIRAFYCIYKDEYLTHLASTSQI